MNGFEDVKDFLQRTFNQDLAEKTEFLANNRKFSCFGCSDKALWLSFKDFFSSPCANKDFIEIVKTFEWVFISNFHACNDDHIDKIKYVDQSRKTTVVKYIYFSKLFGATTFTSAQLAQT